MDLRKDTLFFDALVDFPTYGQEDKLYLDKANGALYYWDGSAYALAGDGTGGVTSVTASSPLSSTEGATPNISITQANGSTNGYLSSTDWTTFNWKAGCINAYTTGTWSSYFSRIYIKYNMQVQLEVYLEQEFIHIILHSTLAMAAATSGQDD